MAIPPWRDVSPRPYRVRWQGVEINPRIEKIEAHLLGSLTLRFFQAMRRPIAKFTECFRSARQSG
jgi:hypothetical protein